MRTGLISPETRQPNLDPGERIDLFRVRFQRALRNCVRRRFSVAECFGVIWLETLEEVSLTEGEEADLYGELIRWAKYQLFPQVVQSGRAGAHAGPARRWHLERQPADLSSQERA